MSGSTLAKTGNARLNQAWVDFLQSRIVYPQSFGLPRAHVFEQDIGLLAQAIHHFASSGLAQVQGQRALALIPGQKAVAKQTKGVALETLDLEHRGAQLPQ